MKKILRTLGRGVHAPHHKNTAALQTVTMPLPEKLYLVMQQSIGAPCLPTVKKGDTVDVGTVVGKAQGFVGADIHSGASGKVLGIEKLLNPAGAFVDAVVIEPDGQQTIDPAVLPPAVRDRESFLAAVRACGLVGLGGAGFPTAVKLSPKDPDAIHTLIINAAECEPYITADDREMLECGDSVLSGIAAVQKYLNIPKAVVAIERNKPEATELMFSLTKGDAAVSVFPLPANYPQGAEKVLIQTVTGREVPDAGGLPADVGVLVLNVTTVSAIGKYLATGMPLMTKRLTVDGGAVAEPRNVEVVIGTPIADVLEFCGGLKGQPEKIVLGGPMMGTAMADTSYPTVKANNAILALTKKQTQLSLPGPCIRCARCIMACPVNLSPIELTEAYEKEDLELLGKLHADVCMGCGVCSYVCPAKRLLSPGTTLARQFYLKGVKK
ncbi:MAG: electron transport complex subunit RsxC [Ruminococcaceae bacterium]|nr:electron transport complex subunit RsxC [Oscillospiraceae bacterium]